jgi:hypothetical protein
MLVYQRVYNKASWENGATGIINQLDHPIWTTITIGMFIRSGAQSYKFGL